MSEANMTLLTDLQYFQSKRKFPDWQPKPNPGYKRLDGSPQEQVVKRCLQFVDLEVQVGEWIKAVATQESDECAAILLRNAADEVKHDDAIRDLATYYRLSAIEPEANEIKELWQSVTEPPVVAAYALEMGIFFTVLPILMRCGDVYASTVASWINDDERVHVETNLRLMKHFGLKLSPNIVRLVYNTVAYIYMPLGEDEAYKQAERAVKRLVTTKDPQMLNESLPTTISYFEQNTSQDIVYN